MELQIAHIADLDVATLQQARVMLDEVFDGDFEPEDWEHSLGGMHALAWVGGWQVWQGPSSALTPAGVVRTEAEDGFIYVFPGAASLDVTGELTCDWRDGDVW